MTVAPPGWRAGPGTEPAALIREARRRQHRRWLATGLAMAVLTGGAAAVIAGVGGGSHPRPPVAHGPAGPHARRAAPAHTAGLVTVSQTSLPGNDLSLAVGYRAVWVPGVGVTYEINDVSGRIVRTISTPGTLETCPCSSGVAATGAGAVWVTHGCHGIYRIDPHSGRVTASLRAPGAGGDIAVAGGLVWVTSDRGLLRIQPRTGQIIGKPVPVGAGTGLVIPGAGALWVTSNNTDDSSTIYRVDPATGAVRTLANPIVTDVQAVGAGSLWTSQVLRVDPATGKTTASDFLGASQLTFWKGSAWALTQQRSLTFLRIDPATNQVTGAPVPFGKPIPGIYGDSTAIAPGPTGLWVLDSDRNLLFHLATRPARP
ncbi:MAG TPA: hypothetical protein VGS19_34640 [Streptosporangiaceae bacterium]|nr:hypothetical protein [Streptosporangiaceae bacterium]